ncbi:MAG: prevent-host-death protein [Lentisphaerae bacterium RIFOXYB12_FULL_65_16]|nr:MAG: prevent-host-death protein [Lentisphaerae bacterium RIFOXYA12_64_32]OGV93911.1 MAG: prevent-host-death protein [Lentisphaerae bacterium RIFOXYB12_FULL_65_16]
MLLSDSVKPISFVKAHASEVIRGVVENGQPVVVTLNGEAKVVIEDVREYERQQETLALLKLIALGKKDIRMGRVKPMRAAFVAVDERIALDRREQDRCNTGC